MTHDTNDAGGGAVAPPEPQKVTLDAAWLLGHFAQGNGFAAVMARDLIAAQADNARLRAFVASLKAKAQQNILITPRHFEAFERGETC